MVVGWSARDWVREFTEPPTGDELGLWRGWFARHNIDPDDVAFGTDRPDWSCWVERRHQPGQYQILYTADDVDRVGRPVMAQRVVDLDAPPEPFPVP